jgi:predicted esterase
MSFSARVLATLASVLISLPAGAVQPIFDPAGASFYDVPFPFELRRDTDGTVSIASFPLPANSLLDQYRAAIEESPGFGIAAGVFLKFDGDLDPTTLPADPEASRQPGSSVFLLDIDPHSADRGKRSPLLIDFRSEGDSYRDPHLLALMPVPGLPLAQGRLHAAVVTDALRDTNGLPVETAPFVQRMKDGAVEGPFEAASLPLYETLWAELEKREGLSRVHVVTATVFRTGSPAEPLEIVARFLRRNYRPNPSGLVYDAQFSNNSYFVIRGTIVAPQFQKGTPPFTTPGTGGFVFDARGVPVVQREENLEFVLAVPKAGPVTMPRNGWPIALCMHGTGGSRFTFLDDNTAARLAADGIASISFDQPLHGLRPGGPGLDNFYNPLYPLAFRDNTRQAAADGLVVDAVAAQLHVDPAAIGVPADFVAPSRRVEFDAKRRRLFFGHSQGATVGPLVLAFAQGIQGGVLSAGGGGLMLNILSVDVPSIGGLTNKQLAELLLGTTLDLFHPVVHLLQMGGEVSDAFSYVDRFATNRPGRPLSVLFTHGMLDQYVTTPLTASMVAAARYPLIEPTFPNRLFRALPGYDYHDAFTLAGLPTLTPPVTGNVPHRRRPSTGGLVLFENDDHFPVFHNPDAIAQWTGFMRSLAYDAVPTIPARPMP